MSIFDCSGLRIHDLVQLANHTMYACLVSYNQLKKLTTTQYVGGGANTTPWEQASEAVLAARELMHKRIRQALGRQESFNEVLRCVHVHFCHHTCH